MLNILLFLVVMKYSLGCNEIHLQFIIYYIDYRFFHFITGRQKAVGYMIWKL